MAVLQASGKNLRAICYLCHLTCITSERLKVKMRKQCKNQEQLPQILLSAQREADYTQTNSKLLLLLLKEMMNTELSKGCTSSHFMI